MMLCPNCGKETPENPDCVECGFPLPKVTSGVLVPDPARDVTTAQPPQKGTSGNLVPDPTGDVTMPQPPPVQQPLSPLSISGTPQQPAPLPGTPPQPPPTQSPSIPWKVIGLILLLITTGSLVWFFTHRHQQQNNTDPTPTTIPSQGKLPPLPHGIGTVQFPNKEYVGVNDGSSFFFDIKRQDSQNLRKQAMDALQKNQDPTSFWNEYLGGANLNDAEISIYRENQQIKNSYPYFTLIVGVDFSASSVPGAQTPTRSALQGIYLAQKSSIMIPIIRQKCSFS